MFIKVHIFAQKSSFLLTQSIQRRWFIAAQHSPAHPTTKPLKPLCQFLSAWENYSENLTLVTRRDRAWVRPSIQMQTTLFQRRGAVSNIASKCPGPETRAMQPARKRSDRTNPGERAGKQLLQPLFCGGQEGWRTPLDSRSQAHQQSALQASVQNDIAGTDPGANSPRGLVASVDLKGRVLSRSAWTQLLPSPQSERNARSQLLDDWLILAQSRHTPAI